MWPKTSWALTCRNKASVFQKMVAAAEEYYRLIESGFN